MSTPSPLVNPDGRKAAVAFTSSFPPGTVGQVVHEAVKPFATVLGDYGSGTIGAHYRERAAALAEPATGANIKAFAETETAYWNTQKGVPGFIGSSMGAQTRETMLNCTKSNLMKSGDFIPKEPK